jgi:hypothetical protein
LHNLDLHKQLALAMQHQRSLSAFGMASLSLARLFKNAAAIIAPL